MQVPFLYRFSRLLVRTALGVYFKQLEISGAAHIPPTGPVIFASNHPHSITDALLLGAGAQGRMVHYVAHSGLFQNRLKAWFLRNCGVIPVYRPREVQDATDQNVAMFTACERVLLAGGTIGIFPEGTSEEERRVQKLKTGCARIALQSEAGADWQLGVKIVPAGLNFESRRRFRSRVWLDFGVPIAAGAYRAAYTADPYEAAHRLTATLQEAIRRRVVNISQAEFTLLVRDVEAIYKAELLARKDLDIPGDTRFKQDQTISREIGRALDFFNQTSPEIIWRITRLLREYRLKRERLRLEDAMLRQEQGHSVRGEILRLLGWGIVALPLALYGLLLNYVPYKITGWLSDRWAADATKVHSVQMLGGAAVFLLWYVPLIYLVARLVGSIPAALLAITAPPAGLFARQCVRQLGERRQMIRLAYLELKQGYYVQQLRQLRKKVIAEMDIALAEYLQHRPSDPEDEPDLPAPHNEAGTEP
jgi:1-acyl-sn-glycerol-3-phosphate acyltransferase